MKQGSNIKIFIIAIIAIIILAGIAVICTIGFNKELRYENSQKIDVYIAQTIDLNKVKEITDEVLGKDNIIQIVEIYNDMVTIRAKTITVDQKERIINQLKEIYEFEQTAEDTTIDNIPATKIIDLYKSYIMPFAISGILILVYMLIRYRKIGILQVLARTIIVPVVGELLLISVIAIARIPVGRFTPTLAIAMYVITILYVTNKNEKIFEAK